MGCCSPNFRKYVEEQEKQVNEQLRDHMPRSLKWLSAIFTLLCLFIAILISIK